MKYCQAKGNNVRQQCERHFVGLSKEKHNKKKKKTRNESFTSCRRFGHFGREMGTLLMVTDTGALDVRILSRNSTPLNITPPISGPPPEQEIPLKVPKKTKLYLHNE